MAERVKMRKQLGLLEGVAIILGIIFGSGIFISPKEVLENTGSVWGSLVVWAVCGSLATLGALSYAELGTMLAQSGGDYHYIHQAYGSLPAFLYLWDALLVFVPTTNAIMALTFASNLLQPIFPSCNIDSSAVKLIAAVTICFLTFINAYNVKLTTKLQNVFMFTKISALFVIIVAGIIWMAKPGGTENFENGWQGPGGEQVAVSQWSIAFYSGIYSYSGCLTWNPFPKKKDVYQPLLNSASGWTNRMFDADSTRIKIKNDRSYLNFMTEELRDPNVNLPRAIYISLPLVTIIYVLANVSYMAVLGHMGVLSSNAIAVDFAARALSWFSWAMPTLVAIAIFGGLSVHIMASSRMCFVGARNGHMPELLAHISIKCMSPLPSLLFLMLMSLIMLIPGSVGGLITYCTYVESLFTTLSCSAVLWLRYKKPDLPRPIKVPVVVPSIFVITCLVLLVAPMFSKPFEVFMGILITLTGLPVYFFCIRNEPHHKITAASIKFTHMCQKLLYSTTEEKEE